MIAKKDGNNTARATDITLSDVMRSIVQSLADAQASADIAAIEQILKLGVEDTKSGSSKLRTLEILTERADVDGKLYQKTLVAPLLALSPPSHLQIKSAEISFDFNVIVSKLEIENSKSKSRIDLEQKKFEFFGYVVSKSNHKTELQETEKSGITVKLNIESPPISDKFGLLIDQIGNSFLSKDETEIGNKK